MPPRPFRIPLPSTRLMNSSESPTSPASPLSPPRSTSQLTPPPRLHLRTIIPSPPLPAEFIKTAPNTPYPWIWRCHLCGSIYRLGATRRCLEDGHYFCSLPSPPSSPAIPTSQDFFTAFEESSAKSGKGIVAELAASKKKSRSRRKRTPRGCRSEFDYAGWSKYNVWRREVTCLKREQKKKMVARKLARGLNLREKDTVMERSWKGRDCWKDCDFPSECHNERKAEREWEKQMKEIRESEERWAMENSWDDVEDKEVLGRPESAMEARVEEFLVESIEKDEGEDKKAPGVIGEEVVDGMENLGPLGTDCDGLGEQIVQAEYTTKRRKSLDAAMMVDYPPNSPLKECSFGFEDPATGCQVWSKDGLCSCAPKQEEETYLSDGDGDIQMKEVSMAKSLLLRYLEKDVADETFGDEDVDIL